MNWKLGSQVRVVAPNGEVFVSSALHFHSQKQLAFYTMSSGGILPFIVNDEFLKAENVSDRFEEVSVALSNI